MSSPEGSGRRLAAMAVVIIIILVAFGATYAAVKNIAVPSAGTPEKTVKVGCVVFKGNGYLSKISQEIRNGLELWASQVNKTGIDVSGVPVNVKIICREVNENSPNIENDIRLAYNYLINTENVDVLLGPPGNQYAVEAIELAENSKVPLLLTWTDSDILFSGRTYNYTFQLMTPIFYQITQTFSMLNSYNYTGKCGLTNPSIAIIYEANQHGKEYNSRILSYARTRGFNLVFQDKMIASNATGVVNYMVAQRANPNILFLVADNLSTIKNAIGAVLNAKDRIPTLHYVVIVTPTVNLPDLEASFGTQLDGMLYISMWEPTAAISPFMAANLGFEWFGYITSEEFVESYVKAYGSYPTDMAALGYNAGLLIQYALTKSGSLDKTKIAETIKETYIMMPYGVVGFGGSTHFPGGYTGYQLGHSAIIVQYHVKGDTLTKLVVWPKEFAAGQLSVPCP